MRVFALSVQSDVVGKAGARAATAKVSSSGGAPSGEEREHLEVVDGVPVQRVARTTGWHFFNRLADYCIERRDQIHVVQFVNLDNSAFHAVRRLQRAGIGTVYALTVFGTLAPNPVKKMVQRLVRGHRYNLCERVVCGSTAMADYLVKVGVKRPIHVIPHGVDLSRFRPAESQEELKSLRDKLGLHPEWEVIVAVGAVGPRKGTDWLVRAFARVAKERPMARLVLVGPHEAKDLKTDARFAEMIKEIVQEHGLSERIIFTGAVRNVEEYLRGCDVMAFPSRREGMPNSVLEGMASGLPVVMTPFLGLTDELGTRDKHFVLSDWDDDTLAADILEVLADRERQRNLSRHARHWVESRHAIDGTLDQYAALYRQLMSEHR